MVRAATMLALVLLVAAGCGDDEAGGGGTGGGGDPAELAGPVVYKRAGGFDGRIATLTVQPDGRGTLSVFRVGDKPVRLTPEQLDALAAKLEAVDLESVPVDSGSSRPSPDAYAHVLTYGGRTITTDGPSMPDAVRPVIAQLGALVDRFSRR